MPPNKPKEQDTKCTWKTVMLAQRRLSKFFLSQVLTFPSVSLQNLHPNMFIPRILKRKEERHCDTSVMYEALARQTGWQEWKQFTAILPSSYIVYYLIHILCIIWKALVPFHWKVKDGKHKNIHMDGVTRHPMCVKLWNKKYVLQQTFL